MSPKAERAIRVTISGDVEAVGFPEATARRAAKDGLLGWVRDSDGGSIHVHAEGDAAAVVSFVGFLRKGPRGAHVEGVEIGEVKAEGHARELSVTSVVTAVQQGSWPRCPSAWL